MPDVAPDAQGLDAQGPGTLRWQPALERPDLLAAPVAAALRGFGAAHEVVAAAIDSELADTAAFCAQYAVSMDDSVNCVVIAGRRGELTRYAACMVLATTRADVNGVVRRLLDSRKASFADRADAVELSGMEFGGITPVGLPEQWPVYVDAAAAARPGRVVIGSGIRASKLALPAARLAELPGAVVIEGLAS